MDILTGTSVICLLLVGGLASLGVFTEAFHDTLVERVGLSLVAVWAFIKIAEKLISGQPTEPINLVAYLGLALFAAGFACEVFKHAARKRLV